MHLSNSGRDERNRGPEHPLDLYMEVSIKLKKILKETIGGQRCTYNKGVSLELAPGIHKSRHATERRYQ